jgi:hypothetical protein
MTQILKQSTQVDVRVGPFVAVGDGFTPVLTAEVNAMDEAELLLADGAATRAFGQADTGLDFQKITGADGWVDCRLSTTDTATVGTLDIVFQDDSLFLPVHARFQVVEGLVYDRMYATNATGADTGSVSVAVWGATTRALTTFAHDTGVADTVWKESSSTYTGDTGSVGYAQGRLMAAHGDTGAIHIVSGKLAATDSGIAATVLDTGKVSNAVWNSLLADHRTAATMGLHDTGGTADAIWGYSSRIATSVSGAVGSVSGNVDGSVASVTTVSPNAIDTGSFTGTAAFANDTGVFINSIWNALRADHLVAGSFGRLLTDSGMAAAVLDTGKAAAAIWTNHATRQVIDTGIVDTGVIVAAVWDQVLTGATHNISTSAGRRLRNVSGITTNDSAVNDTGIATPNATTTVFRTDLTEVDNFWNDSVLIFTSGALSGQSRTIANFANANGELTVDEPLTSAPANNVTFVINSTHVHPISQVAGAVWDEADTGHADTGSYGRLRQGVNVTKIADDTGKADNLGRMFADTGTLSLFGTIIADAVLDRNMATGTDNEAFNFRTPRGALSVLRNRVELDTGTIVVTKEDDTTVRWSGTTESDTGSDGVKTVDPASA